MTHSHTLADPRVEATLSRMFKQAEQDQATIARLTAESPVEFAAMSPEEQSDAAAELYLPISAAGGKLLYSLVRATKPTTVVEFGTSFGVSTLFLAAAVRDNGTGHVVTTEYNKDKVAAARGVFTEAGLDDLVTVLEGDARETLRGLDGPVDFVLLDGWKELSIPVLKILEPSLRPGTLVLADDIDLDGLQPYLDYVRDPDNGYESVTFPVEDGIEISCRL